MDKIKDFFKKHNIQEKDVPKAIILYKTIGTGITITIFTLCYRFKPIKKYSNKFPLVIVKNNFIKTFPKFHKKLMTFIDTKSKTIAESKYFKPLPDFFKLKSKRTTIALGETILFKEILTPITLPFKLWLTAKFLKDK